MASGTGTFAYDVTTPAAAAPSSSGTGTFTYGLTTPAASRGTGTFTYDVTLAATPFGLFRRTGTTTAVKPRLFRRTGLTSAVELIATSSGGGGTTPPTLTYAMPGELAGATPAAQLSYSRPTSNIAYVDPYTGTSSGAGTVGDPVQTTLQALAKISAGGTIVVGTAAQEYVLHEGIAMPIDGAGYTANITYAGLTINKQNVTVQPYPGATVIYDGTSQQTGWAQTGTSGVWSKALVITADRGATDSYGKLDNDGRGIGWLWTRSQQWHDLVVAAGSTEQQAQMFPLASWPEQVWIDGVRQTQVATLAEVTPGSATFYVEGASAGTNGILWTSSRYHLGTNPTGKDVRVSDLCTGLASGASGVTFRGLKTRRYAGSVQMGGVNKCRAINTTWENCLVEDCMVGFESLSDGARFVKCEGWRCGQLSYKLAGVYGYTFDRCVSELANSARFNWAPVSGGIKITTSRNGLIVNCRLNNGFTKGWWTDVSCYGLDVVNTDCSNNEQFGAVAEISTRHRIVNCTMTNNGKDGLLVHDSNETELWHNTVKNNGAQRGQVYDSSNPRNVKIYQDNRRVVDSPSDGGTYQNYGRDNRQALATNVSEMNNFVIEKLTVYNNVMDRGNLQFAYYPIEDLQKNEGNSRDISQYGLLADGNLFARASTSSPSFAFLAPGAGTAQTICTTLAQWRSVTGQDSTSVEVLGTSPTDSKGILLDRARWSAGGAQPVTTKALPADLAALVGVPAGNYPPGIIPIPVAGVTLAPLGITGYSTLTFSDEFDAGTDDAGVLRPDYAKWRWNRYGGKTAIDDPFNKDLENAAFDPKQVTVAGGQAHFTVAQRSNTLGSYSYDYVSGTISSEGRFNFAPGSYVEARIRVPKGAGLWPAFWACVSGTYPPEIDGFEFFNTANQQRPQFNFHPVAGGQTGPSYYGESGTDYTGAFHTYGFEYRTDGLVTPWLDGVAYPGVAATDPSGLSYFVILNLSVYRNTTPPVGAAMDVDWVRMWRA